MKKLIVLVCLVLVTVNGVADEARKGSLHIGVGSPMNYGLGAMMGYFVAPVLRVTLGLGFAGSFSKKQSTTGLMTGIELLPIELSMRPLLGLQVATDLFGARKESSVSVRLGGEFSAESGFLFKYGIQRGIAAGAESTVLPFIEIGAGF